MTSVKNKMSRCFIREFTENGKPYLQMSALAVLSNAGAGKVRDNVAVFVENKWIEHYQNKRGTECFKPGELFDEMPYNVGDLYDEC